MKSMATVLMLATVALACVKSQAPNSPSHPTARNADPATAGSVPKETTPEASQIVVDRSILEACGISDAEAFFEYDSARVSSTGKAVVQRLANCFSTGPLKGETVQLVGHADPRGSVGYNMELGSRRAESVKESLGTFGLSRHVIMTSTRGESEARGVDSASWTHDRRVDVTLRD